jgi:hypothetical protein
MTDNTIKTDNSIEVYTNDIYRLVDEYIDIELLGDKEQVKESFMDMIFYISDRIPKPSNDNIQLLDDIFNIYIRLCSKYKTLPTIEQFSFLVNINNNTLSAWGNNEYRIGQPHSLTVKKWKETCKKFLINNLQNSKGGDINKIFIAKAAYGMVETAPVQVAHPMQIEAQTPEQIAKQYNNGVIDIATAAELPPV